jgi:hypothetical protein
MSAFAASFGTIAQRLLSSCRTSRSRRSHAWRLAGVVSEAAFQGRDLAFHRGNLRLARRAR